MWRSLYTAGLTLAWPLFIARLLWKSRHDVGYRQRLAERHGLFPHRPPAGSLWVHAVSVGEVQAARALIATLRERHPERAVILSTITPTGYRLARELFGDSVQLTQLPYDLPLCLNAFLRRVRPAALVLIETELWPNLVHCCRRAGLPVFLANARLSPRSAARYSRLAPLREMFAELSGVSAQSREDGERFVALGLPAERLQLGGNLKVALEPDEAARRRAREWRAAWTQGRHLVWIAASTHDGEDGAVLDCQLGLEGDLADTLLVLVPRHPERCDDVAALCRQRGLRWKRHSEGPPDADSQVLLVDSIGELSAMFGAADLAFIGGSLVPVGGHNMLEAAVWGIPVLSGEQLFNFRDIADQLRVGGALALAANGPALARLVRDFLSDPQRRQLAGAAARLIVCGQRDAVAAQLEQLLETL